LIATDTSGEENHATLTSSNLWIIGREGGALKLNGTNDYATAENVNVGNQLTVAAWICSSNLVGEHAVIGEAAGYTLKTSGTTLRFTTPGIKDHSFAANFVTGQWYHVVVTFEAGISNGCKFYVNGQFRGATNAAAKNLTTNATWLGRNQWGQYFSGLLDDVRIYRAVLSQSEISALYANHSPAFAASPLLFPSAIAQTNYQPATTLVSFASDPDISDTLTFRKISGPDWLSISTSGIVSGPPLSSDAGTNLFSIQVRDNQGAVAETTLRIVVAHQPSYLLEALGVENGRARLAFTAKTLQSYQVLGSSNLVNWMPIGTIQTDNLGRALWADSIARSNAFFFRIQQ
jgi:hypothetical protein